MNQTEALFSQDRFAAHSHIELLSAEEGRAAARMEILPEHLNGIGIVQGGAIYTLADFALAAAANSRGVPAVTLTTTVTFFAARRSGVLTASASEISLQRSVATYQVDVTDETGVQVASLQGTVYRRHA